MNRPRANTYRDGFDANLRGVGAKPISFATNPIGSAAPSCGSRSFPCRFERERIGFKPSTGVFGSFLCGIDSFPCDMKTFPCGNKPFPHGNDLQQLHEESIDWGDTRFFHVELTRFHMEMAHCYIGNEFFRCRFETAAIRFKLSTIHFEATTIRLVLERCGFTAFRYSSVPDLCVFGTDPTFFTTELHGSGVEKTVHEVWAGHLQPTTIQLTI